MDTLNLNLRDGRVTATMDADFLSEFILLTAGATLSQLREIKEIGLEEGPRYS